MARARQRIERDSARTLKIWQMEAYIKAFKVPPEVDVCLVHDGSAGFGPDSYAIQASIRAKDGMIVRTEERMDRNQYNHPEGKRLGKLYYLSVAAKIARVIGKLYNDYFLYINGDGVPIERIINLEPEHRTLARAF